MKRHPTQRRHKLRIARLFMMDTSGSMAGAKLADLQRVLLEVVRANYYYKQDVIGLSSFDTSTHTLLDFTRMGDLGPSWRAAVGRMEASGTTNMATALYQGIGAMARVRGGYKRTIVLLSDGIPYPEKRTAVLDRIPAARRYGIRINTIGFGPEGKLDVNLMQVLAAQTGGEYVHAQAIQQLAAALRAA